MKTIYLQMKDGFVCVGSVFEAPQCQCVLQIIHGAKEHRKRYYELAEFLCEQGVSVYIFDARGHGESINRDIPLGHMPRYITMLSDIHETYQYIRQKRPGMRFGILAHSLGSVFTRCLIQKYPIQLDFLILSGVANYVDNVKMGLMIARPICLLHGSKKQSKLLIKLGDSSGDDWVCSNQAAMDLYRSDPLCSGYLYSNGAITAIWEADAQINKTTAKATIAGEILFISGAEDPVTGGPKGLASSEKYLINQGYFNIRSIVYPGMRHEVLNETEKYIVWNDVLNTARGAQTNDGDE